MEPAKIDWKNLEWRFVEDELYEHINAPKWFDFLSADSLIDHQNNDEAWFCRPDCNHPKTAQDFLKSTTPSKLASAIGVSEISPFGHRNQRDFKLKRRVSPTSNTKSGSDSENQNPNQSTPPSSNNQQAKIFKATIKSSAEKKEATTDEAVFPRLKSTLSGKNLFAGRDILTQITEFCNELKRMAMKPRDNSEKTAEEDCKMEVLSERKPMVKEKPQGNEKSILKEKTRITRNEDTENIPISVKLENVKRKDDKLFSQIRTNPPSPQCFSATKKATPSKSKLMEKGVLREQNKQVVSAKEQESADKHKCVSSSSIVESKQAKTLDVFWFLKPCTLPDYNDNA